MDVLNKIMKEDHLAKLNTDWIDFMA